MNETSIGTQDNSFTCPWNFKWSDNTLFNINQTGTCSMNPDYLSASWLIAGYLSCIGIKICPIVQPSPSRRSYSKFLNGHSSCIKTFELFLNFTVSLVVSVNHFIKITFKYLGKTLLLTPIFFEKFNKPCVNFLRVGTKNTIYWKFWENFRKISNFFLWKLRKIQDFSIFFKKIYLTIR